VLDGATGKRYLAFLSAQQLVPAPAIAWSCRHHSGQPGPALPQAFTSNESTASTILPERLTRRPRIVPAGCSSPSRPLLDPRERHVHQKGDRQQQHRQPDCDLKSRPCRSLNTIRRRQKHVSGRGCCRPPSSMLPLRRSPSRRRPSAPPAAAGGASRHSNQIICQREAAEPQQLKPQSRILCLQCRSGQARGHRERNDSPVRSLSPPACRSTSSHPGTQSATTTWPLPVQPPRAGRPIPVFVRLRRKRSAAEFTQTKQRFRMGDPAAGLCPWPAWKSGARGA